MAEVVRTEPRGMEDATRVNNAGKQLFCTDLAELPDEQFDETMKTKVYAMFWLTTSALPHLPAGSTIITTTSVQAYLPSELLVDYATTKAAINTFIKALGQQLARRASRVNAVAPGPIWTPLQVSAGPPPEKLPGFRFPDAARPTRPAGRAGAGVRVAGVAGVQLRRGRDPHGDRWDAEHRETLAPTAGLARRRPPVLGAHHPRQLLEPLDGLVDRVDVGVRGAPDTKTSRILDVRPRSRVRRVWWKGSRRNIRSSSDVITRF